MKGKKFSLLRILTVGAACALTSIFLFCGCSAKPAKSQAPDGADAYGVYTNLTLSLDCGEGKVWASVKNTFTLMPSKVRVSVELYASEDYKPSYKEMSLVSENAVTDLNMGGSVTAEATTNGKEMFWQARAYYKVDEKDWQERTTKIWQIKGNGNIVTTNAQPPKTEELPAEPFRLADVIDSEPVKLIYRYRAFAEPEKGDTFLVVLPGFIALNYDDEDKIKKFYEFIKNIELCNSDRPAVFIGDEVDEIFDSFTIMFNNAVQINVAIKNNGQIYCTYAENSPGYYDIGENHKTFVSEEGAVDLNLIGKLIEKIKEINK